MRYLLAMFLLLAGCATHVYSPQHHDYQAGSDMAPGTPDICADRQDLCPDRPEDFDGNPRPCMGTCDMGAYEFVGDHTFSADLFTLSESAGGLIQFNLDGGLDNFQRPYLILGSLCGTSPGVPLPGGMTFRLNMDPFTVLVYATANTPFTRGFTPHKIMECSPSCTSSRSSKSLAKIGEPTTSTSEKSMTTW